LKEVPWKISWQLLVTEEREETAVPGQSGDAVGREGSASTGDAARIGDAASTDGVRRTAALSGQGGRTSAFKES
jgi:hypothetical protein